MELRDTIAIEVMKVLLKKAHDKPLSLAQCEALPEIISKDAYIFADEMLSVRGLPAHKEATAQEVIDSIHNEVEDQEDITPEQLVENIRSHLRRLCPPVCERCHGAGWAMDFKTSSMTASASCIPCPSCKPKCVTCGAVEPHSGHLCKGEKYRKYEELLCSMCTPRHGSTPCPDCRDEEMRCGGSGYKPISPFDAMRIAYGRAIPCDGCEECPCPECWADKIDCDRNREAHGVHLNRIGGE